MASYDVAVVGGGVIGCAIAFQLAREGVRAVVLERDSIGAHASGAAAGMLAPITESERDGPLLGLGADSLELFPDLVGELAELSGIDPKLVRSGILRVAGPDEAAQLRERARGLARYEVEWLEREETLKRESALAPELAGAMWSPREASVDPLLLTRAFAGAARRRGAEILEGAVALGLARTGERVVGVRTASEEIAVHDVVVCTGAWSRALGAWAGADWPVRPVKGQMLSLEAPQPPLRPIVWSCGAYLVPRPDGSVRVGATVEEAGFDARPTAAGISSLLAAACAAAPVLRECRFGHAWAGLRPATPDELPLVGPVRGHPGLWIAAGHHRNGILLSPLTARAIAAAIVTGEKTPGFDSLRPERFHVKSAS